MPLDNRLMPLITNQCHEIADALVELDQNGCWPYFSRFPFGPGELSLFPFGPAELSLFPSPHPPNLLFNFSWAYRYGWKLFALYAAGISGARGWTHWFGIRSNNSRLQLSIEGFHEIISISR